MEEKVFTFDDVVKACPNLVWKDISKESVRWYGFDDKWTGINLPVALSLKEGSSGHRIINAEGFSHYIPGGWTQLAWRGFDGVLQYNF